MRKRDTYDEIVHSLETESLKLNYPNKEGTFMMNSPQVSAIRCGASLDVDEMTEK